VVDQKDFPNYHLFAYHKTTDRQEDFLAEDSQEAEDSLEEYLEEAEDTQEVEDHLELDPLEVGDHHQFKYHNNRESW